MRYGKTVFLEKDVERVISGKTDQERYLARKAKLAFTDTAGHWKLAQWCKARKLRKQYRAELDQILAAEPNHELTRKALGHMKVGKKWLPKKQAMLALGYYFYRGKWHTPDQLREMRKKQALSQRNARLQKEVNGFVYKMALKSDKQRKTAHDGLVALARREGIPQLIEVAGTLYRKYGKFWSTHRHVVVEIRATNASLGGIDLIPTSIASGGGPTGTIFVEAPRITMSKVNSTVMVPSGGGG